MADTLIKMKTGSISALEHEVNNAPTVPLDRGSIYFAVDTNTHVGKIVYDAPVGTNGVDRIVMSTQAEYAQEADVALRALRTLYGTCDTAADTKAKIVKLSDVTIDSVTFTVGMMLTVKFTNTNNASSPTLTVQRGGSSTANLLTAKAIYRYGTTVAGTTVRTTWEPGAIINFIYDGTGWVMSDYHDRLVHQMAVDTTSGVYNLLSAYTTANTSEEHSPVRKTSGLTYNPSTHNLTNNGAKDTAYYIQGNSTTYGRMFINAIGTAGTATTYTNPDDETQTVTGYTGNTQGVMLLELGNNKAVGTNGSGYSSPGTAGNANNARGYLRIYGAETNYTDVLAQANGNRTVYLPNYNNTMYLVHAGSNSAIGSASKPVYVAANGRVTEGTAYAGGTAVTLNNASKAGSTASFYAPTAGGTAGQYLKAAGATSAPTWASFTKPTLTWTGGTTAGPTLKVKTDGGESDAATVPSATASASGIVTTGAQTLAGAKTFTGDMTISKSTTIANNSPATLNFSVTQTDNNKTTSAYIKVFDDADNQIYGTNMVIQSAGAVIIGGGESPSALYGALGKTYTQENLFLTADGSVFAEANANTIANRVGFQIDTSGNLLPVKAETKNNNVQSLGVSGAAWKGLYLGNASSAYNENGVIFSGGSRLGENTNGDIGLYAARKLYIKPLSPTTSSSTDGILIDGDGLYPVVDNTESLGLSTNKWANIHATTVTLGQHPTSNFEAATKYYVDNIIATNDAMVFKGTLAGGTTTTYTPAANRGWTYKVSTAGLINKDRVEIGDILICTEDSTVAATSSNVDTVKKNWVIIQNNVDGAVFKSTNTFTDGQVLIAEGTAGKIKTSGYTIAKSVPSDAVFTDTTYGAEKGISLSSGKFGHSNTAITAQNTQAVYPIKIDAYGHITGYGSAQTILTLGTTATTAAAGNHEHTIYPKWQTTTKKSTELYDYGFYVSQNAAAGTGPTAGNYFTIFNVPYRKASGNTKADYGWQIGGSTSNDSRLFYRTSGDNVWGNWQEIAHGAVGTAVGSATQPVYMSNTGVITAGTALKALAYKDSLTASDVGAATANHTHTTTLATDTGTATVTLAHNTTYKLTAGGTSVIFKTPTDSNTDTKVNVVARGTTKAYLLADTTAPTSTAAAHTAVAETAVYLDTTAGKLVATSFAGNGSALTNLNADNLSSGTVPIARIPTGTSNTTVALGDHNHDDVYATKTELENNLPLARGQGTGSIYHTNYSNASVTGEYSISFIGDNNITARQSIVLCGSGSYLGGGTSSFSNLVLTSGIQAVTLTGEAGATVYTTGFASSTYGVFSDAYIGRPIVIKSGGAFSGSVITNVDKSGQYLVFTLDNTLNSSAALSNSTKYALGGASVTGGACNIVGTSGLVTGGYYNVVIGSVSAANGMGNTIFGSYCASTHSKNNIVMLGKGLLNTHTENTVILGAWNVPDDENTPHTLLVGGGDATGRKNIFSIDREGNVDKVNDITMADSATLHYNSTTESLDFIFA